MLNHTCRARYVWGFVCYAVICYARDVGTEQKNALILS